MYVTLRQYTGITPGDFDCLISRSNELELLMREVPGFVQYRLVRTAKGITSVAVFQDRVGAEVANFTMAAWIEVTLPALLAKVPVTTGGEQVLHFST
jgi:hypothetical protein